MQKETGSHSRFLIARHSALRQRSERRPAIPFLFDRILRPLIERMSDFVTWFLSHLSSVCVSWFGIVVEPPRHDGEPALRALWGIKVRRMGVRAGWLAITWLLLGGCDGYAPPAPTQPITPESGYQIGPGDSLNVFVWRNPELSVNIAVRPDGRLSIPLVEDVVAGGRTPTQLARDIEQHLSKYVKDPIVTVMVGSFVGPFNQQVRVVGEAVAPRALPYRENMTVLDAMIQVGGLTKFAAGNRATLIRSLNSAPETYALRLESLLNYGEIASNAALAPGDIIIIPQTYF
jgi:polysaccharide export outer membrane protein